MSAVPPFDGTQVCAQVDPEVFFPDKSGTTRPAKALCRTCPLQLACLDYALATEHPGRRYGVWGGLSAQERDKVAGRRPAASSVERAA